MQAVLLFFSSPCRQAKGREHGAVSMGAGILRATAQPGGGPLCHTGP